MLLLLVTSTDTSVNEISLVISFTFGAVAISSPLGAVVNMLKTAFAVFYFLHIRNVPIL